MSPLVREVVGNKSEGVDFGMVWDMAFISTYLWRHGLYTFCAS